MVTCFVFSHSFISPPNPGPLFCVLACLYFSSNIDPLVLCSCKVGLGFILMMELQVLYLTLPLVLQWISFKIWFLPNESNKKNADSIYWMFLLRDLTMNLSTVFYIIYVFRRGDHCFWVCFCLMQRKIRNQQTITHIIKQSHEEHKILRFPIVWQTRLHPWKKRTHFFVLSSLGV